MIDRGDRRFLVRAATLSGAFFVLFLTLGILSPGTHNDDDLGRYLNTRAALGSWDQILSLWNRPAFVLLYLAPARLGYAGVEAMTAFVSALTCFLISLAAHRAGIRRPLFVGLFTAAQPYFLALSYSALTEPLAACCLSAALAALAHGRLRTTALLASIATLARLETAALLPLWALAISRADAPRTVRSQSIVLLPIALVAWHAAGWIHTRDHLFLWREIFTGETRTYHAVALTHYLRGWIFVVGAAGFGLAIVGGVSIVRDFLKRASTRTPIAEFSLAGAAVMLAVLTWLASGSSAGQSAGFLRHLVAVSPFFALVALRGFDDWMAALPSTRTLIALAVAALLCVAFLSVRLEGGFELGPRPEYRKLAVLLILLGMAVIRRFGNRLLPRMAVWAETAALAAAATLVLASALASSPIARLTPEQTVVRQAAEWTRAQGLAERPLLCNHVWFNWTLDRTDVTTLTQASLAATPAGAIAIWEGHYSHRLAGDVSVDDLRALIGYRVLHRFVDDGSRFYCVILERLSDAETLGRIEGSRFVHDGFGVEWPLPFPPWRWEPAGIGLQLVRGALPDGANAQLNLIRLPDIWDPQAFHRLLGAQLSATPGVQITGPTREGDWSIYRGRADGHELWVATSVSTQRSEALQLVIYGPPGSGREDAVWERPDVPGMLRGITWR